MGLRIWRFAHLLVFIVFVILTSCSSPPRPQPPVPLHFYGVAGRNEGTRFEAKAIRTGGNAGRVEVTLPDGELCIGDYSIVSRESSSQMSGEWVGMFDFVYGSGF